jgi:hypothetical protein
VAITIETIPPVQKTCFNCEGSKVSLEHVGVEWDRGLQLWVYRDTLDGWYMWCKDCNTRTNIIDKEIG